MKTFKEHANEVCDYLKAHGFIYTESRSSQYCKDTKSLREACNVPETTGASFMHVLVKLHLVGILHKEKKAYGRGFKWNLKRQDWNRLDPFEMQPGFVPPPSESPEVENIDDLKARLQEAEQAIMELNGKIDKLESNPVPTQQNHASKPIIVKVNDLSPVSLDTKPHPKLERVLKLCAARLNCLLIGPAGSGKTHLAKQVAVCMSLDYSDISCSAGMSEGHLLGRLLPTGENGKFEYSVSEFVKSYETGGVFLFDEVDAADPNTLLILNTCLANGHLTIPNRMHKPVAKKHKDFICLAAANTFGTGADRQYVGRNQLDEAFLDRFRMGQVVMDYDESVEAAICPNRELRERIQKYRKRCRDHVVRRVISSRFMKEAYAAMCVGLSIQDVEESLFGGWRADEIQKVKGF